MSCTVEAHARHFWTLGLVRSVAVEPSNKWIATDAGDRVIKIWNLASGELRLSVAHRSHSIVRGLVVSPCHPYLFSCGEDKVCLVSSLFERLSL